MKTIILAPNEKIYWYELILEAEVQCSLHLSEELESYLVFLMMRFISKPEIALNIIALEFLNCLKLPSSMQIEKLREIGDQCLIFSGLFPGLAKKRNVSQNYYADLGRHAYFFLANLSLQKSAELYQRLGEQFLSMKKVLNTIRPNVESFNLSYEGLLASPLKREQLVLDKKYLH